MSFIGHAFHSVTHAIGDVIGDAGNLLKKYGPAALTVIGVVTAQPELVAAGIAAMKLDKDSNKTADEVAGVASLVGGGIAAFSGGGLAAASGVSGVISPSLKAAITADQAGGAGVASFLSSGSGTAFLSSLESATSTPSAAETFANAFSADSGTSSLFGLIGKDIGSFFDNVGSNTSGMFGDVLSGIEKLFSGGFSGFLTDVDNIATQTSGVIDHLASQVDGILSPIGKTLDDVDNVMEDFENKLVLPITQVITQTEDSVKGLVTGIHNDLENGLQGLVAIPGTIADALTSEGAALQRSQQELGGIQQSIVTDHLVPGIVDGLAGPIHEIAAQLLPGSTLTAEQIDHLSKVNLATPDGLKSIEGMFDALNHSATSLPWFLKWIPALGQLVIQPLAGVLGAIKSWERVGTQGVAMDNPTEPLGAAEATRALRRGVISPDAFAVEMARQGIDATRAKVIYENTQREFSLEELIHLFFRGLVSHDEFTALAHLVNVNPDQAELALKGANFLFSVVDAQALQARGAISEADKLTLFAAHGMLDADMQALPELTRELPSGPSTINAYRRRLASTISVLHDAFDVPVPPEVQAVYAQRQIDPRQMANDWINHWDLPSIRDWMVAWWRDAISEGDLDMALEAKAVPPLLWDVVKTLEHVVPPFWYMKEIAASGEATRGDIIRWCVWQGFTQEDAGIIATASLPTASAVNPDAAANLAKLSATTAKDLYLAGTINAAKYTSLLESLGYGPDSAQLTVELETLKLQAAQRKTVVDNLVAQAKVGALTNLDVASQLYGQGFTADEVDEAQATIDGAIIKAAKLPSRAELDTMLKKGAIDETTWGQVMSLLGYSTFWQDAYLKIL